ncbi:hypothetical protein BaRGS_00018360 [Batillaria attramentaria]|uniref:IgGFc-binding protein N-terminal domain-containing protein n=1 Tax=Batillaria attramentaria TaxID=370345 RepID=A0ABD0KTH0_9CAEN
MVEHTSTRLALEHGMDFVGMLLIGPAVSSEVFTSDKLTQGKFRHDSRSMGRRGSPDLVACGFRDTDICAPQFWHEQQQQASRYGLTQELIVSNPTDTATTARVQFPQLPQFTQCLTSAILPGGYWRVELNDTFHVGSSSRENQGIYVTSSGPVDVQVLAEFESMTKSKGGYKALPLEALSADYVMVTQCVDNNCFGLIVLTENGTDVNISLRLQNGGQVTFEGVAYADDDVISTGGDAGHVIQVTCYQCDISGTFVRASRPVAVIAGGEQETAVYFYPTDMLVEQLLPWHACGTRYILREDEGYELVKVITGDVITTFSYDGVTYTSSSPRQVFQFTRSHGAPVEILADDKVLVAQFIMPDFGDYVMVVPLPVSLWKTCYDVFVYGQDAAGFDLELVTETNTAASLVTIKGVMFTPGAVPLPTALLQPSSGYLRVQTPSDCVSAPAACYPFSGYLYAYSSWKAWSIPIMSSCFTEGVTSPANMISEESFGVTTECPTASTTTTESVTTVSDATPTVFGTSQGQTATALGMSQGQTSNSNNETTHSATTVSDATSTVLGTSRGQTSNSHHATTTSSPDMTETGSTSVQTETTDEVRTTSQTTTENQKTSQNPSSTAVDFTAGTDSTRVRSTTAESTTVDDTPLEHDTGTGENTVDPAVASTTAWLSKTTKKRGQCPCNCGTKTTSEPEDFVGIVTSMQNDLRVNRKELSRYKRTKTSAQDPRASAMRVGVTGVSFLAFVFGLLLSCDLLRVYVYLKRRTAKVSNRTLERDRKVQRTDSDDT